MNATIQGAPAPLAFQNVTFDVTDRNGQPWLRVSQIARALGYNNPDAHLTALYKKHAAEFTDNMTALVKLPTAGGEQETRIFSLRGAHLLGMFARTPVAAEFRRWVLDILDQETAAQENPPAITGPASREQCAILATLLNERFQRDDRTRVFYLLRSRFGIKWINELPASRFVEACAFVQAQPRPRRVLAPEAAPRNALVLPATGWVTFHAPGNAPVSLPIQGLGGGVDTRWLLVCTRFHGLYAEQLSSDALTLAPAELPDFVRDSGRRVPRKAVLDILEACVSRLK